MQATILKQNLDGEFYTEERCYIAELLNVDADPDVSIARARVEPGVTTAWHHLVGTTERYVIVSGEGLMEVGDLPRQLLRPGDGVLIPPECRQRITNTGSEDLIFLAICSPRFRAETYVDLEG